MYTMYSLCSILYRSSDFDYSNDHRSVPSSYDDTSFRTNQDDVHHDDHPPPSSEPTQQQHTVPQDTNEYEHQPLRNALDSFKESPSKPPSDSDFNAILNTAHDSNVIASKSNNLTKEKFLRTVKMKKRPKLSSEKDSTQNPSKSKSLKSKIPLKSSSKGDSNVLNRHAPHGLTESASHILSAELKTGIIKQDRKRKHSVIDEQRSDSENEQVDIESYYEHEMTTNSPSVNSSSGNTSSAVGKQPFYASTGADNDESSTSLVVSLPLHSTKPKIDEVDHIIEENTMMQSTDQKKRKKHHRQRKKKHALQDKDSSKTDKPLTLKISVKREND